MIYGDHQVNQNDEINQMKWIETLNLRDESNGAKLRLSLKERLEGGSFN